MVAWYATTLFVSAMLLFIAQPMVGKMMLPRFGGTPAVWTGSMLFFQGVLLAGYLYAHCAIHWLGARRQAALHLAMALLPLAVLPIAIPQQIGSGVGGLLVGMFASVAPPLFIVSATAPMLQRWFATSASSIHRDPYSLYAASNVGSLLALALYPFVVEPAMGTVAQSLRWRDAYLPFYALLVGAACFLWRRPAVIASPPCATTPPGVRDAVTWTVLAMIPSSLMLGVTTHITTDVAATPLLWVIPLAIYLLTFIWAFSSRVSIPREKVHVVYPVVALVALPLLFLRVDLPLIALLGVHGLLLLVVAILCHGELRRRRPGSTWITTYFAFVALGGVFGGVFNAVLAPLLFDGPIEYPLMLVIAGWVRGLAPTTSITAAHSDDSRADALRRDDSESLSIDQVDVGLWLATAIAMFACAWLARSLGQANQLAGAFLVYSLPAAIVFMLRGRPTPFAIGLLILWIGFSRYANEGGGVTLLAERNFFGSIRVVEEPGRRLLIHGSTIHGIQSTDPALSTEPLAYFHKGGPVGDLFDLYRSEPGSGEVAVAGLGIGSIAAYGEPGWRMTFIDIDPAMIRIASDRRLFTHLSESAAVIDLVEQDARLYFVDAERLFDLIILDAFASDSVPFHLLTREAIELYRSRLAPDGLLAFNITNRYLNLEPLLARLALEAQLSCRSRRLASVTPREIDEGLYPVHFVVMARDDSKLARFVDDHGWKEPTPLATGGWTDDHASVVPLLK